MGRLCVSTVLAVTIIGGTAAGQPTPNPPNDTKPNDSNGNTPTPGETSTSPNNMLGRPPYPVFAAPTLNLDAKLNVPAMNTTRVLTLNEALDVASKQQPSLQVARANTEVFAARTDQLRAGYYPSVIATASYARQTGNAVPRPGTFVGQSQWSLTETYNNFNAGVTASWLLYDFGQIRGKIQASEASQEASKATENNISAQTALNVRRAYFQSRAQRALVRVANEVLTNQQRHLAQVQALVKVGTRPEIDLAQEKTNVANARLSLLTAQNNYDLSRAQLNQAMGIIEPTNYEVTDDEIAAIEGEESTTESLAAIALSQRQDLASLEKQKEAQRATIRSIRASYAPSLSAQASVTEGGVSLGSMVPNWTLGLTLTWPIFQGGIGRAQIRESEANIIGVQAQIDVIKLQVSVDLEQARLSVRAAKATISAANEVLVAAREQLRLAEGRYQAGIGSVIELGDAQVAVVNASAQVIQAQYNLSLARAQLLMAMGRP